MKKRDSNIELLRLICMLLIVFQHCIHICAFPEIWNPQIMSAEVLTTAILVGLTYVGVNCFVLISGYYGIKLKLRSVLNLYLICAIYALIGYLLHIYIDGANIDRGILYHSLFCISHSSLWFVKCYAGLILLSPLLNEAMEHMSRRNYQWVLALLTILNVYFGFLWKDRVFNADGYTIANFVYIYIIGGYISRYVDIEWCRKHKTMNICIYLTSSLLWSGSIILERYVPMPREEWFWGYNNPFTLIGSISFFMLFLSIPKFYNKWINWLAAGTFAVYVVHCGRYIGGWYVKYVGLLANYTHAAYGIAITVFCMLLISILIVFIIATFDKLRACVMQPFIDKVCALFAKYDIK